MERPKANLVGVRRWLVSHPRRIPLALFCLVAAFTLLSVFTIERAQSQREFAELNSHASLLASALEGRAEAGSAYLQSGAALLSALDEVPGPRFRRFVSDMWPETDQPGAQYIGWAQVVRADEVDAFNSMIRKQGTDASRLDPPLAQDQPFAVPVTLLSPETELNRRLLGFDMFSDPVRRAAMLEAVRNERPTASGKVAFRQFGQGEETGFLIYMPVFSTIGGSRQLLGFLYSPYVAQDYLASALEAEQVGSYGFRLYDTQVRPENLLAEIDSDGNFNGALTKTVTIAHHRLVLEIDSPTNNGFSSLALLTLFFGLLGAGLLVLVLRMLIRQVAEDEVALRWFEEQVSIRDGLTRELNHRVKNTLANVLSIIALTRRRAADLDEFADGLDGRVRALSGTYDLLTGSDWGTTPIRALLEAELAPYLKASDHRISIIGPDFVLAPGDALALGLAIHELATNAAKFGALSVPGGTVKIDWAWIDDGQVRLTWCEGDGPPVNPDAPRGLGSDLIEKLVARDLGAPVELVLDPAGVRCIMTIPIRKPATLAVRAR